MAIATAWVNIATAVTLAPEGKFDGRVVNVTDEAPLSIFELVGLSGVQMASKAEP